jgi:hypothetical protein
LRVTAVLPSRGPLEGGTWANIVGSGFVRGIAESPFDVRDLTDVTFGDNSAIDIEIIRDDMISVRTPPGVAGWSEVVVDNPNGRASLPAAFDYYESVRVDSLTPVDYSSAGGTPLTILGTGFTSDTGVLIGSRPAAGVQVESSDRLTAFAPPGAPGAVDVEVVNRNGNVLLFRAATYHPTPRLDAIEPAAGPASGASPIAATGAGFEPDLQLRFADATATDLDVSGPDLMQASTPAGLPGQVDVTVIGAVELDRLPGGFVYLDAAIGALRVSAVAPSAGPEAGGQSVTVVGEGFAAEPIGQVTFAGQPASDMLVLDDRRIRVTVPAGQPGQVSVEVQTASDQALLASAYRYYQPLSLSAIEPTEGPAPGGTEFLLTGDGFSALTQVFFGGLPADNLEAVSPTQISGTTPAGSTGSVDVLVADPDSQAGLPGGFEYTAPLTLQRVDPDFGSQAGGTYVTLYGQGFSAGMQITFGAKAASLVQVQSPAVATARSPSGDPGEVPVRVTLGEAQAELPAAFSYIDPTNDRGGASGGPIHGAINVTCLDGSWTNYGAPVPGASVVIDAPALSGLTDDRGQVTFSGPSLVREVTLTAGKQGFESITVAALNAANLTVYLYPNEQEPVDPGPYNPTYSAIEGRVFGFKDIPGLPVGPDITYEARVYLTSWSIYSVPPYGGVPRGTPILTDGGWFQFAPLRLGQYSLYAMYGAFDSQTEVFTPALLGVRREIRLVDETPASGQDVVLSTPLDRSVVVHLIEPPLGTEDKTAEYGAYVSLDLGSQGIIYLNQAKGIGDELVLTGLPQATADSFLFVGLASLGGGYPFSYTFRRQSGDLQAGVELGPFLGFTELLDPPPDGELNAGRIAWSTHGPAPELTQLLIQTAELMPKTLWRVIVPGEVTEVQLPAELLDTLPQGEPLLMLLYTANSPRFNFDRFNYGQLSSGRWTSYTVNFVAFTAP